MLSADAEMCRPATDVRRGVRVYRRGVCSYNPDVMSAHLPTIDSFSIGRCPRLSFGVGARNGLAALLRDAGVSRAGIITGARSLRVSPAWRQLQAQLRDAGLEWVDFALDGEPGPAFVDQVAAELRRIEAQAVIAIGGGSSIDAGKAAAAAFHLHGPVADYLEGVGTRVPDGRSLPLYALPTTGGTGTEATRNAVLSEIGERGFKKSLRHENYAPVAAIVDPELAVGCPASVTAASGMDAITQLIESYVSTTAAPFTDALAESGLLWAGRCIERAVHDGSDIEARAGMAYAAYLSGICLANAGLGIVHGAASPAGAALTIPHGVFCGTLLGASVRFTLERLDPHNAAHAVARRKYARIGVLLSGRDRGADDDNAAALVGELARLTDAIGIPRLGCYGFGVETARAVAFATSGKSHPVELDAAAVEAMLLSRL
ncbi:MAG: iron-containing alcohol dehydrogenase [Spirochaetaceae bacterium]|nr:MAG: iron-containing alcohol dehydrogenase [Spirochaetaceae bacterium]